MNRKGPNGRQQSKRVASEINLAADPVMVRVCSGAEKRAKGHRSNKTQDSETRPQGEALCYSIKSFYCSSTMYGHCSQCWG